MPCHTSLAVSAVLLFPLLSLASPPTQVVAQDAQAILETMRDKEAERWEAVDNFTIVKSIEAAGGLETPQYFVKMEVDGQTTFRLVPAAVYERGMLEAAGFPPASPELYEQMARGYDLLGPALEQGGGDQPPMPGVTGMTSQMSTFLRGGAEAVRNLDDGTADAEEAVRDMTLFAERARLAGTEPVLAHPDGTMRNAHRLEVDDIEITQETDGGSFTLRSATLWIDAEHFVQLRLLMEGEIRSSGESSPVIIEKLDLDYRVHEPLYVPHREVFRLSGIMAGMSEDDREQMEEAREQLAEAEAQLAAMPDGPAKAMAQRMMAPQLERFRQMVEGDAFETTMSVVSVAVDEGPPTPYGLGTVTGIAGADGALTMATEIEIESGRLVAELAVLAGLPSGDDATFTLVADLPYPAEGGSVVVTDASGSLPQGQGSLGIESASGSIVVGERTDTKIAGTFQAQLTGTGADGEPVTIAVSGTFDSGAPAGPYRAPRGSPIPARFGMGN